MNADGIEVGEFEVAPFQTAGGRELVPGPVQHGFRVVDAYELNVAITAVNRELAERRSRSAPEVIDRCSVLHEAPSEIDGHAL